MRLIVYVPKDIAGVVIVAFETEISVADWLVAKFSPTPIPAAASPAITHMTARRIEVSLPRANQNQVKKNAPAPGPRPEIRSQC